MITVESAMDIILINISNSPSTHGDPPTHPKQKKSSVIIEEQNQQKV